MGNKGRSFGSSMWREGSERPSSFERKYPVPSRASSPTKSDPPEGAEVKNPKIKKTKGIIDPWGSRQKMPIKDILIKAKDRDIRSRTSISEIQGKQILEKNLGTGYVEKSALKKTMQDLETKSRHASTMKEREEAGKELNYLRHIEKSLEKK